MKWILFTLQIYCRSGQYNNIYETTQAIRFHVLLCSSNINYRVPLHVNMSRLTFFDILGLLDHLLIMSEFV